MTTPRAVPTTAQFWAVLIQIMPELKDLRVKHAVLVLEPGQAATLQCELYVTTDPAPTAPYVRGPDGAPLTRLQTFRLVADEPDAA